jgi:hypothetical protein
MSRYFGRVYKLEIGNGDDVIVYDGNIQDVSNKNGRRFPAQIEFTIDQTPAAWRSYAEIIIYGVARERRQAIYNKFDSVRLTAGYQDAFGVIFNGEIENVELGRSKSDTFVKLFCNSSERAWQSGYIRQSFGKGTPQINIIRAVAASFGLPVEIIGDFSKLPKAVNGFTVLNESSAVMTELSRNFGFEWMHENGKVLVIKDDAVRPDSDTFKYSILTGLVGSPSITVKGIDVTVLLDPFIRPYDYFEVEAVTGKLVFNSIYYSTLNKISTGKGIHKVLSTTHEGNFYGDAWRTKIEGVRPHEV